MEAAESLAPLVRSPLVVLLKRRPVPRLSDTFLPVPQGELVYDSLGAVLVDLLALWRTLEVEGFTGYVRLLTNESVGLLCFEGGLVSECAFDSGRETKLGPAALDCFAREVMRGRGVLDVVSLSPELAGGMCAAWWGHSRYAEALHAGWVRLDALLEFLEAQLFTGSLVVRASSTAGVVVLRDGNVVGAYTGGHPEVGDVEPVLALGRERGATIEVVVAGESGHRAWTYEDALVLMNTIWQQVLEDLLQAVQRSLGWRGRKVRELLASAPQTRAGVEAAIVRIPQLSIPLVSNKRLEEVARELGGRLPWCRVEVA